MLSGEMSRRSPSRIRKTGAPKVGQLWPLQPLHPFLLTANTPMVAFPPPSPQFLQVEKDRWSDALKMPSHPWRWCDALKNCEKEQKPQFKPILGTGTFENLMKISGASSQKMEIVSYRQCHQPFPDPPDPHPEVKLNSPLSWHWAAVLCVHHTNERERLLNVSKGMRETQIWMLMLNHSERKPRKT